MKLKIISVIFLITFFLILFSTGSCRISIQNRTVTFTNLGAKNPKIKNLSMIIQKGSRPRFSPDGSYIVFDRRNSDGYYDLYMATPDGDILSSFTEKNAMVNQKNNGNGVFHPSGKYIIFISEENQHLYDFNKSTGDPGVGLFCNLWAMEISSKKAWKLTDIPITKSFDDSAPAMGVVNPYFTPDGKTVIWTERYGKGGNYNWGKWRIKAANFIIVDNTPAISDETVLFTPLKGNYVTFLGFPGIDKLLLSGNLDGQHEYGMDEYVYDLNSKELINLTNTPEIWEEDATVTKNGYIIYMSNKDSEFKLDFDDPDWENRTIQREYYIMTQEGGDKERLTYFNDPSAPEYLGNDILAAASDISPDGKTLAATIGIDFGTDKRDVELKIALINLN